VDVVAWVTGGVVLLVVLDRVVAHGVLDRGRPRTPRSPRASGTAAAGALGDLIDVFQPSRTHVVEEQERQRHDRQDDGDGAPPVDLDAGTVRLGDAERRPGREDGTRP
jgi:hypothetical protein